MMRVAIATACPILLAAAVCSCAVAQTAPARAVQNTTGLKLLVASENTQPTLRIVLPDHSLDDRTITVIFPEHVTMRRAGTNEAEQLYLFRPGETGTPPEWRYANDSIQYEMDLKGGIHFLARATLQDDGVLSIMSSRMRRVLRWT